MSNLEFMIYCIYGKGQPFYLHTYKDIDSAKFALYDIIKLEKERNRVFFVDNDFFNNEYPSNLRGKYFCIKQRKVSDWEVYSEYNYQNMNNNKIIYFNNFR